MSFQHFRAPALCGKAEPEHVPAVYGRKKSVYDDFSVGISSPPDAVTRPRESQLIGERRIEHGQIRNRKAAYRIVIYGGLSLRDALVGRVPEIVICADVAQSVDWQIKVCHKAIPTPSAETVQQR